MSSCVANQTTTRVSHSESYVWLNAFREKNFFVFVATRLQHQWVASNTLSMYIFEATATKPKPKKRAQQREVLYFFILYGQARFQWMYGSTVLSLVHGRSIFWISVGTVFSYTVAIFSRVPSHQQHNKTKKSPDGTKHPNPKSLFGKQKNFQNDPHDVESVNCQYYRTTWQFDNTKYKSFVIYTMYSIRKV